MEKTNSGIARVGRYKSSYKRGNKIIKLSDAESLNCKSYSKAERDAEMIRKYGMVIE
jgi:hypothetical protein